MTTTASAATSNPSSAPVRRRPRRQPAHRQLAGLDGDDEITGGTGEELLSGGPGNDRIDARDGAPDAVDCGNQALDWAAIDIDAEASISGCAQITS